MTTATGDTTEADGSMPSFRGTNPVLVLLGAIAGMVVSLLVGTFVVRAVASLGEPSGWEDLVAIAVAVVAFVPVGGVIGGLSATRLNGVGFWRGLGTSRRSVIIGALLASFVAGWVAWIVWDPMSGVAAAVWALPVGGLIGFLVDRRRSLSPVGF